jgi:hypothetical protein
MHKPHSTAWNLSLGTTGYYMSPDEAQNLEMSLDSKPDDEESRWKLLGFYYAHQSCCPDKRNRRLKHILWEIEHQKDFGPSCNLLMMFYPEDQSQYSAAKSAWLRRLTHSPRDPNLLASVAEFLSVFEPGEACQYYEHALEIRPEDSGIQGSLRTAQLIAKRQEQGWYQYHAREPMTCYWDVLSCIELLLEATRNLFQPGDEIWNPFAMLVRKMGKDPTMLVFAQHCNEAPLDSVAVEICRNALQQMYKMYEPKSDEGKLLRRTAVKRLWKHLVST